MCTNAMPGISAEILKHSVAWASTACTISSTGAGTISSASRSLPPVSSKTAALRHSTRIASVNSGPRSLTSSHRSIVAKPVKVAQQSVYLSDESRRRPNLGDRVSAACNSAARRATASSAGSVTAMGVNTPPFSLSGPTGFGADKNKYYHKNHVQHTKNRDIIAFVVMNILRPPRPKIVNKALGTSKEFGMGHRIDGAPALAHAVKVTVTLGRHVPNASPDLVAATLLHDAPYFAPADTDLDTMLPAEFSEATHRI